MVRRSGRAADEAGDAGDAVPSGEKNDVEKEEDKWEGIGDVF